MDIRWHRLPFTHVEEDGTGCGNEASILEIAGRSDGMICVSGVCVRCGVQFSSPEVPWATIMRNLVVKDYERSKMTGPLEDLERMEPQGLPC